MRHIGASDTLAGSLATRPATGLESRALKRPDVALVGLLVALVLLPLYPKIGLLSVGGTYIPVRIDDLITVGVLTLWAIQLWRERRRPRVPRVLTPALAWLAAGLVAVVVGAGLLHTVGWTTSLLYWAKPIEYLLLGWVAYDVIRDPARRRLALIVIFGTAAAVCGYGILQRFGWVDAPASYVPGSSLGVVTSTFADRHQFGMYLGMMLLLVVLLWHRAGRLRRVAAIVSIIVATYLLAQTSTRSEYFMMGALGLLLLLPARTRIPAVALVASVALIYFIPISVEQGLDALFANPNPSSPYAIPTNYGSGIGVSSRGTAIGGGDVSLAIRFERKWPELISAAMADPIFGIGPSAATEAADGHYVRSFVEVGIVGTAAFVWLILAVVGRLRRVHATTPGMPRDLALAVLLMIAFIAVVGILIDAWVASRPMQLLWPLIGIALAAGGSAVVGASAGPGRGWPSDRRRRSCSPEPADRDR